MKGLIALLIIGLIAFCGYNYMQVQDLKQQVARLETKLNEQQSAGVTDKVVAEATRINARYIEALERDDVEQLPGVFFYKAFIRQYAKALELNEAETERILRASVSVNERFITGKSATALTSA